MVRSSTRRLLIQLGVLGGIAGFVLAGHEGGVSAGGDCPGENECTFKKPNFMIVMDYSSSMNVEFDEDEQLSRWDVAVDAVQNLMVSDNGFLQRNMHVGLMRFGHDPDPGNPGTPIPNDTSGLIDGQALDVPWYDADSPNKSYFQCNGQGIINSLDATPAPLCEGQLCSGIGTWTKGALDRTAGLIDESRIDHPDDVIPGEERFYGVMVITDGNWTGPEGTPQLAPDSENPAITAANLYTNEAVPTYVVAVADAVSLPFANELAQAGGTGEAIKAEQPANVVIAIAEVVLDIANSVILPECIAGLPRIMIILDSSSSMLNVGDFPGDEGETGWDQARAALAAQTGSLFDVEVTTLMRPVEDLVHLGLISFGNDFPFPGEQKVLVQYGPCMKDNFAWALNPWTSCEGPGCTDPWSGPQITWTFKDGSTVSPFFDQPTQSHMPACEYGFTYCTGSGTFTHLGVNLARQNMQDYRDNPPAIYPIFDSTVFRNILITDGQYNGYSTDTQVQQALESVFDEGAITYVIGFGDGLNTPEAIAQLEAMADWGSAGALDYYDAGSQAELEAALEDIVDGITFDPCCAFNDCSENPEPTTNEPDPTDGIITISASASVSASATDSNGTVTATDTDDGTASVTADGSGTDSADGSASNSGDADGTADGTATVTMSGTDSHGQASDVLVGRGCACRSSGPGPAGLGLIVLGLAAGFRRRRARADGG